MSYRGRFIAVGIVFLFNVIRYFYYHQYMGLPFEASFFILTAIFFAVAWVGGKQYDLVKFYAEKDPLTNTYNRRTVDIVFKKQAGICKMKNKKLGIVLIDLDDFKEVNDKLGHQKGDELLRCVADVIKMNAKKEDFLVRWGGDEFVHIIPDSKEDFHLDYILKLKEDLSHAGIHLNISIKASIGIAVYPDDGESFDVLIRKADTSMYDMKREK
ncbi:MULTISPECIES: GGDEF domain-containing protein [Sporosarcina]|uniref:GGDEF domain-containing protein n=1 Tax=Sporosarcina TaxID=1569 RepID=UPI0030FA26A8